VSDRFLVDAYWTCSEVWNKRGGLCQFASEKQVSAMPSPSQSSIPLGSFRLPDVDGRLDLKTFQEKVLLIVNTASICGNTPQYAGLQEIYNRYRDRGFEVLAFSGPVTWNFQKYLVDRSGGVIGKYDPGMDPLSPAIRADLERALARG
jgi:glutathione peroxidase